MNRRQARIEALKTAIVIMEGTDMGTFIDYMDIKDSFKVWDEFQAIKDSLQKKWDRLEKAK